MWQITAKPLSISANIPPTAILNIKVYISCFQGVKEQKGFINQQCLRATLGTAEFTGASAGQSEGVRVI